MRPWRAIWSQAPARMSEQRSRERKAERFSVAGPDVRESPRLRMSSEGLEQGGTRPFWRPARLGLGAGARGSAVKHAKGWLSVGLVIGAIAVGVLLAEAGLRLFYPQQLGVWYQDREGLGLHWPGLVTRFPQSSFPVAFNSAGLRDREHAVAKPEGVFRVLVLGDSFMEALQVPFEESFPSVVEHELSQGTGRRVEVVNASVSGWGTDDELTYLTRYGMQWKPDLILVAMTLHNDISDNLGEQFHTIRNGELVERPRTEEALLSYELLQLKAFLASKFHAYQLLLRLRRAREIRDAAKQLNSHVVELFKPKAGKQFSRGLELTALLLERIQTIASSERSRVVIV